MKEVKTTDVEFVNDDHIWVDNRQYVSLKRFSDARTEMLEEVKLLNDKNKELAEENAALKVVLKNSLNRN